MIQVLTTGKNPTRRHLRRVQTLSLRGFYERVCYGDIVISYIDTDKQAADIHTKMFTDPEKWNSTLSIIQVVNTDKYKDYESFVRDWIKQRNAPPKEKKHVSAEPVLDDTIDPMEIGATIPQLTPPYTTHRIQGQIQGKTETQS